MVAVFSINRFHLDTYSICALYTHEKLSCENEIDNKEYHDLSKAKMSVLITKISKFFFSNFD
jgi:hypothetical protein